jgi:hypothetical protein
MQIFSFWKTDKYYLDSKPELEPNLKVETGTATNHTVPQHCLFQVKLSSILLRVRTNNTGSTVPK